MIDNTNNKLSIFISYAREDSSFVQELKQKLEENEVRCYGDWDLTAGTKFELKLKEGNLASSLFLFILSPDSVKSNECKKEIALAVENKKVILPVSYRDHFDDNLLDSAIRTPQWVFIRTPEEFEKGIQQILLALKTDFELLDTHSRLLLNVDEWIERNKSSSYLLKKQQLKEAEDWLQKTAIQPDKLPQPTSLQIELIVASQRSKAKATRVVLSIAIAITLLLAGLSGYAFIERARAKENAEIAKAKEELAERNEKVAIENLTRFKIEEFSRNVRNGKIYLDANEFCLAKAVFDSAVVAINDPLLAERDEIKKEKSSVIQLQQLCNTNCK